MDIWLPLAIAAVIALIALHRSGLLVQLIAIAAAIAILLGLPGCAEYDAGGDPARVLRHVFEAQTRGETVAIKGDCISSCALKLSAGDNLCVSPTARIGVHEVRSASSPRDYRHGTRNHFWTAFFEGMLPACAREVFDARGGMRSGTLATASGSEILAACPQIRPCAE